MIYALYSFYVDVIMSDKKFAVNVNLRALWSPAWVARITCTRLKHISHQGDR